MSVKLFQVRITASRQSDVTPAILASSRASAPKLRTAALPEIESARAPPIRVSSDTERWFRGRAKREIRNRLEPMNRATAKRENKPTMGQRRIIMTDKPTRTSRAGPIHMITASETWS